MEDDGYDRRFQAAKRLLDLFKLERWAYLGINFVVLAFLIPFGVYSALHSSNSTAVIAAFFGMTGAVTFTTNRVLRMWSEVFRAVMAGPSLPEIPDELPPSGGSS